MLALHVELCLPVGFWRTHKQRKFCRFFGVVLRTIFSMQTLFVLLGLLQYVITIV